jgi:hypothetical protein
MHQFKRALSVLIAGGFAASMAVAQPELCVEGECAPLIKESRFANRAAYTLSDGKTQAVIVPSLGRVMSYGTVGGANLLWHNKAAKADPKKPNVWANFGGDKTWPAPQSTWGLFQKSGGWPPPREWDGMAHEAEVLPGGSLRMTSRLHAGMGARTVRTFSMSAAGELVIEQAIEKFSGAPLQLSIWSVTQIPNPDAIFVRANPDTPYKGGFHWIAQDKKQPLEASTVRPGLVHIKPVSGGHHKIGVDSLVVALAAVTGDLAFVQKSTRPTGEYPDGALGAGFPMEIYHAGKDYNELEILSPLRTYFGSKDGKKVGTRFSHTVRWSLHRLKATDAEATADEVAGLLNAS